MNLDIGMNNLTLKNLLDDFELLESWEDRYRYIIDLGNDLEPFPEEFKIEQYRVLGCASQVWFYPTISVHNGQKLFCFQADSDAIIVRGLIKILAIIYNNKLINELRDIDPFTQLRLLGLQENLSSQRSNGLKSIISKIQEIITNNS